MDEARDARLTRNLNRFLLVLLGATVSVAAFIAVIQGWHAFAAKAKFEAITFLFFLVTYPIFEIVAKNKQKNGLVRFSGLICGYILILLSVTIFAAR